MTMRPTLWFKCDKCGLEAYMPVANTPVHQRNAPPDGWMTLRVGEDPATPMAHLCASCSTAFTDYFRGGLPGQAGGS